MTTCHQPQKLYRHPYILHELPILSSYNLHIFIYLFSYSFNGFLYTRERNPSKCQITKWKPSLKFSGLTFFLLENQLKHFRLTCIFGNLGMSFLVYKLLVHVVDKSNYVCWLVSYLVTNQLVSLLEPCSASYSLSL